MNPMPLWSEKKSFMKSCPMAWVFQAFCHEKIMLLGGWPHSPTTS